jgi:hypothetical protein
MKVSEWIMLTKFVANGGIFCSRIFIFNSFSFFAIFIELLLTRLIFHLREWVIPNSYPFGFDLVNFFFKFEVPLIDQETYRHSLFSFSF